MQNVLKTLVLYFTKVYNINWWKKGLSIHFASDSIGTGDGFGENFPPDGRKAPVKGIFPVFRRRIP